MKGWFDERHRQHGRMPSTLTTRISGAILAGGKAQRFGGAAKGLLERAPGETVIAHLEGEMKAAGLSEILICANEREPYLPYASTILPDLHRGLGPLAGIEAALAHVAATDRADAVLFLPCDLPAISAREIRRLREAFVAEPRGIKMAVTPGEHPRHPTCCVMHRDLLPRITAALDEGRLRLTRLWEELGATAVAFSDPRPFVNLNTPADLAAWRAARQGGET